SAVLRGERRGEPVYLKAVFPLFHHEPAVTEALAAERPSALPDVLAVDRERGWLLMRELAGTHEWHVPDAGWARALRLVGEIQRDWAGRRDELVALGGQDRSLSTLADPLSCVHQAVSYRAITASLEPDDRWWFEAEPKRWIDSAYRRARGNASQPG